jgi:response regulator of citrate/malate metabolism
LKSEIQIRVLLIEDSIAMQSLIQSELQQIESVALVGVVRSTEEARPILDWSSVDLVIADMFLSHGTAFEVLEWRQSRQPKPSVIIITNAPSQELRERCFSSGASGFFDKAKGFDWLPNEIEAARRNVTRRDILLPIQSVTKQNSND